MVERVLVVARGNRRTPVLMEVRLARHLVARGGFEYVTEQIVPDEPVKKTEKAKPKKRAYKRRDMQAED